MSESVLNIIKEVRIKREEDRLVEEELAVILALKKTRMAEAVSLLCKNGCRLEPIPLPKRGLFNDVLRGVEPTQPNCKPVPADWHLGYSRASRDGKVRHRILIYFVIDRYCVGMQVAHRKLFGFYKATYSHHEWLCSKQACDIIEALAKRYLE